MQEIKNRISTISVRKLTPNLNKMHRNQRATVKDERHHVAGVVSYPAIRDINVKQKTLPVMRAIKEAISSLYADQRSQVGQSMK